MSIMGFEPFRDFDRLTSQLASGRRVPHGVALDAWRSGSAYQVALDRGRPGAHRADLRAQRADDPGRARGGLRRAGRSAHRRAASTSA